MIARDNKDCFSVLLYSCSTTINCYRVGCPPKGKPEGGIRVQDSGFKVKFWVQDLKFRGL